MCLDVCGCLCFDFFYYCGDSDPASGGSGGHGPKQLTNYFYTLSSKIKIFSFQSFYIDSYMNVSMLWHQMF